MADPRLATGAPSMSRGEDIELFRRWAAGDASAGELLVRGHYDAVYCFLASKVPEQVAVELTQETFETMCKKASSLELHSSFSAYLLGIARWKLVERLRRRSRDGFDPLSDSCDLAGPWAATAEPRAETWLDQRREESVLVKALRQLPLDDQILLELRIYEGLRMREIAEILGMTKDRVASRLSQSKRKLVRAAEGLVSADETMTTLVTYMKGVREELVRRMDGGKR